MKKKPSYTTKKTETKLNFGDVFGKEYVESLLINPEDPFEDIALTRKQWGLIISKSWAEDYALLNNFIRSAIREVISNNPGIFGPIAISEDEEISD